MLHPAWTFPESATELKLKHLRSLAVFFSLILLVHHEYINGLRTYFIFLKIRKIVLASKNKNFNEKIYWTNLKNTRHSKYYLIALHHKQNSTAKKINKHFQFLLFLTFGFHFFLQQLLLVLFCLHFIFSSSWNLVSSQKYFTQPHLYLCPTPTSLTNSGHGLPS